MNRPIRDMLDAAQNTTRFHMPGHKGCLCSSDMTELPRTDDLYSPVAEIRQAELIAAQSCDAANTLSLTGGSTAGLMAMILSAVAPGETLQVARNAHHAVYSACVWGDIVIQHKNSDAPPRAMLITRPDYYGHCEDLAAIIRHAHSRGTLVLVDEAHGAHFPWWDAPQSAGALGADAWVQSAHKTLPALTGAAWLHLSDTMDAARARRFLRMVQTSSPPFPILQSLDDARAWMDENGREALRNLCDTLAVVRTRISALGGYLPRPADDPTRLVIDTRAHGYSGMEIQSLLEERRVDVEMSDDSCIVCICTVSDIPDMYDALLRALSSIPQKAPLPPVTHAPPPPGPRLISVRAAALSPQEAVLLPEATGRIAAASAGMYPPGIPFVLPGEQVTAACVEKLLETPPSRRFGVEGDHILCTK